MYAKLINGTLSKPGKFIFTEKWTCVNPTEEILYSLGYKPVFETEQPENREGYYLIKNYEE